MAGQIRVASIPSNHPYVRNLAAQETSDGRGPAATGVAAGGTVDAVVRLADPRPDVPHPQPGQWWPPVMLDARWVRDHHAEFDLAHLHFGFDAADPAELCSWADELARHDLPLVLTVHDLVNPHFVDQRRHSEHLDALVPAATEVITLTPGAAAAIRARWGRTCEVIPHPHVVPLDHAAAPARSTQDARRFVIGVNAKNLRANVDPLPVLLALDAAMRDLPRAIVRVDLQPEVMSRDDARAIAFREWLRTKRGDPRWLISVHPMFTDAELWAYLGSLDLCVLPYRFGTHSGWLEACVDLGTAALVPQTGYYSEQHGHPSYRRGPDGSIDQPGLADTLRRLYANLAPARPARPDRTGQRRDIAAAHERLYRRALGGPTHPVRIAGP